MSLTRAKRIKNSMMKATILRSMAMILKASMTNTELRTLNQERMASFATLRVQSMTGMLVHT